MSQKKRPARTATYFEQVKVALNHYADVAWLGEHSPLAAPYFLGAALQGAPPTASGRGTVLQQAIDRSLESLWGGPLPPDAPTMLAGVAEEAAQGVGGRYHCLILELNYCRQCFKPAPKSQAEIYNDILHISRPTHDRHLAEAVARLGEVLLQRLRPTIRPEQPHLPNHLIGRDALLAQVLDDLHAGRSVSLTGAGGVGKTSLAALAGERWPSPAVFWFTLRPTFNDQLDSLIFALGHFLHEQGASTLWQQLVADGGRFKESSLALGLARRDLAALTGRPLLCFDELDFLRPSIADQPNPRHVQLLEFIDSLRTHTPLLLIGQRAFWESDVNYVVAELTLAGVAALLHELGVPATATDQARLHAYTAGNPRLVALCAALYWANPSESFSALLDELPQAPALLPLWQRLERRLPAEERRLAGALSVYRTPAPADVWSAPDQPDAQALHELIERRLVLADAHGGVALLPALRQVIYDELPLETREHYHLQAATSRAERGEYTAAAYHLQQGDQPDAAVTLWYANRAGEINRGQAGAALGIFEQISLRRLPAKSQTILRLLRSELYQLTGEPEKVIETLGGVTWPAQAETSVDAALLLGKALDQQGRADAALATYGRGLETAAGLLNKMVQLHVQRSLTYLHERTMSEAWREVQIARYVAENMLGTMHEQSGQLDAAREHYEAALAMAQASQYLVGVAKTYHNLGNLAVRKVEVEQAITYYNQAMSTHQQLGDRFSIEIARSGLAAAYLQAARYQETMPPARQALTFFQAMGDSFWIALNASNLAEAATALGELAEAESYAQLVLTQEQPHSHPYALFTLGRVREQQQRMTEAELYLRQARQVAEMNGDRYLLAYVWEALGQVYQTTGNFPAARAMFEQAHEAFQTLRIANKVTALAGLISTLDA
jgi:tetratricopeptide (TPR) repeat protein